MKKTLITESERDSILSMYKNIDITTKINLSEQIVTNYDKKYDYKKEGENYYYSLKGQNKWILATKSKALNAIKTKVFKQRKNSTSNDLVKKDVILKKKKNTTDDKKSTDQCISISKEECAKINSNREVKISSGADIQCSRYMIKCLREYDSTLFSANAWDVFWNVKDLGTVKYNAYTDGSIDWDNIYSELKQNKINKDVCLKYKDKDNADKITPKISNLPSIVSNSVPSSSKISISSLELGDIVGLYHSHSDNKGMAFCQRALRRALDNDGNINDKSPFTFNSHVGFVGAIKNGVPIIIHNVGGKHMATPSTQMLDKTSNDMIVWVVSDNKIQSQLAFNSIIQTK